MDFISGERYPVTISVTVNGTEHKAQFDAHIDSKEDYSVETPTLPIEKDFDTTVSTLNRQVQLTMNLFLTPYPVTWASFFGRSIEMVKETLIRLYWMHTPITVKTQDETYEDMAIKSMTFKRTSDTGDAYDVTMVFVHVKSTEFRMGQLSRGATGNGGTPVDEVIQDNSNAGKIEVEQVWDVLKLFNLGIVSDAIKYIRKNT